MVEKWGNGVLNFTYEVIMSVVAGAGVRRSSSSPPVAAL
jgi:hypothetical protein